MPRSDTKEDRRDVGSSWASDHFGLIALVVVVACGLFAWQHFREEGEHQIVIATGHKGGIYNALGRDLCAMLGQREIVEKATPQETRGSAENMRLLANGEAQLAFVQSDQAVGRGIGLIAPLHEELLHILVSTPAAENVKTLADLTDLRVSIGEQGGGTREVVQRILNHLDIKIQNPLGLSLQGVDEAFRSGDLDAAFFLTALPAPVVDELCDDDCVRFFSLGDPASEGGIVDALSTIFPSYRKGVIPIGAYGSQPSEGAVSTVGVSALLVASSEAPQELVRAITRALFEHRADLSKRPDRNHLEASKHIREIYSPGDWMIPYHEGAVRYYRRDDPPFLVEYAEAISLLLTIMVGAFSASLAFRGWLRRLRKNRIDAYYNELSHLSGDIHAASEGDLCAYRDLLVEIRRRAFADLVDEKLEANESFSILQEYLRSEEISIRDRLNRMD